MSSHVTVASRRDTSGAGIMMMILAMALVPMIDVQAKHLVVGGVPAMQVIFLRMTCGTILLLPVMLAGRRGRSFHRTVGSTPSFWVSSA